MSNRIIGWIFFLTIGLLQTAIAQELKAGQECFPEKKNTLVYDVANVISASEEVALNEVLIAFADSSSNQIAVVIVPDLCGMEKAQFAIELGENWGVGQRKEDNGIILLIKPKTPESEGQIFIAVGRGLEGAIPDITTKQIIENEIIPGIKQNGYFAGVEAGCSTLMALAAGEYNSDEYSNKHKKKKGIGDAGAVLLVFGILFVIFAGKIFQTRRYAATNRMGFWAAWAAINALSRSHRGYYNNFSSGRGGFGGFGSGGGGGFGGFGGGGFGGGGAGGSW
jgi:uncharacterized protein